MDSKKNTILVACDSYKGCLSSREVNEAVGRALAASAGRTALVRELEMSDGGEGMLDAFLHAMGGRRHTVAVHDALMRPVEAAYGLADGGVAIIETAQAAGLCRIEPPLRNPMRATTWGVGELIADAYRRGARRFIIGLGGSATSDCGIGMLRALDKLWRQMRLDCTFQLASDVTNPLCGPEGAAHVFAPQKGADSRMVEALDLRSARFAEVCRRHFGRDESRRPGAGAAGGLGYAFMQFFGATACPGAELLFSAVGFDGLLSSARLVITGEGHSDRQTLMGKLPQRVLSHALSRGIPVWLLSGGVSEAPSLLRAGFSRVEAVTPPSLPLAEALKPDVARRNIAAAVKRLCGEEG